jgi:hypothetical protein
VRDDDLKLRVLERKMSKGCVMDTVWLRDRTFSNKQFASKTSKEIENGK